jgi:uncharacterized protein YndB with AHSA1/START domain
MVASMNAAPASDARSLWNYAVHMSVLIARPVKDVWPYFVGDKKNQWAGSKEAAIEYTTIVGEPGQVGEIYTHAALFHNYHLYYEAIRIKPQKQIVLKITYKKNDKETSQLAGYDLINLHEAEGRTTIDFQQVFALPVEAMEHRLESLSKAHDKELVDAFDELRKTVENRR